MRNVTRITYKRNEAWTISTRQSVTNPLNGLPLLSTGTLAKSDGTLAGATDYSLYASATSWDGATVLLGAAGATFISAGGWDYALPASLLSGANGNFVAYLKVYQFSFSDSAHQVDEWRFEFVDGGL